MSRYAYGHQPHCLNGDDIDFAFDANSLLMAHQGMHFSSPYEQSSDQSTLPANGPVQSYNYVDEQYGYQSKYTPRSRYPQQFLHQNNHPQRLQESAHYQQLPRYEPRQQQAMPSMITPTGHSSTPFDTQTTMSFSQYSEAVTFSPPATCKGPSRPAPGHASSNEHDYPRTSWSTSLLPNTSSEASSETSTRNISPSLSKMEQMGSQNDDGRWSCNYPGCYSQVTFRRDCDLRKHYKRHAKKLFCRYQACPQAFTGGFSSKTDQARHEARHNPGIQCAWQDCDRTFSRVDNMVCRFNKGTHHQTADLQPQRDHVRRVHSSHER